MVSVLHLLLLLFFYCYF